MGWAISHRHFNLHADRVNQVEYSCNLTNLHAKVSVWLNFSGNLPYINSAVVWSPEEIVGGTKLWTGHLANEMGISRTPIGEALIKLKGEGLLIRDKWIVCFLRSLLNWPLHETSDFRAGDKWEFGVFMNYPGSKLRCETGLKEEQKPRIN